MVFNVSRYFISKSKYFCVLQELNPTIAITIPNKVDNELIQSVTLESNPLTKDFQSAKPTPTNKPITSPKNNPR